MTSFDEVREWLGQTDIYVLDQVMRGRLRPSMRVLDAGCGDGRNLELLLRVGVNVHAVDQSERGVAQVGRRAAELAPVLDPENFRVEPIEALSFEDATFDAVLCIAALHFARDAAHFDAMLRELWRVLLPGGLLIARLATTIGVAEHVAPLGGGRYRMGDGTERYLVDAGTLLATTEALGGVLHDPLKTTVVRNERAMTTWVVCKRS